MLRNPMSMVACFTVLLLTVGFTTVVNGQQPQPTPTLLGPEAKPAPRVAGHSNLYCAGYIKYQRFSAAPEIVGSEMEPEQRGFSEGDTVFLDWGADQGIKEGQKFQIVRPKGNVKGVFHEKKGFLGTYVRELGQLEVFRVFQHTAVAQITFSCEQALLGDLLLPVPDREAPIARTDVELDRFAQPSGKPQGRLMMARDGREMIAVNNIVYIDLGSEDKLIPGDHLTIFRPLGAGGVTHVAAEEDARGRSSGFQSDAYRGGGFSSQSQRSKDSTTFSKSPGKYQYKPLTSYEVKKHRPQMPRKVVGEMVVIDVQTRTATAIITKSIWEAHTGDWVEIQ